MAGEEAHDGQGKVYNLRMILFEGSQANERSRQRLKDDLGLNDEAVEVIMNLCNQVAVLQARLREVESMVEVYNAGYSARLIRYRQVISEADWEEI
jgi:hypothetical protein